MIERGGKVTRWRVLGGATALSVMAGLALTSTAGAAAVDPWYPLPSSKTFSVGLSGTEQTRSHIPGDPDGTGSASITINRSTNSVCSTVSWSNIAAPVVAGHIHQGDSGQPENPGWTVNLFGPNIGGTASGVSGCTTVPNAMGALMMKHPQEFNVVVHNQAFPAGAIRGRLGSGNLYCQLHPSFCWPVP
jgi:hypothetical protein